MPLTARFLNDSESTAPDQFKTSLGLPSETGPIQPPPPGPDPFPSQQPSLPHGYESTDSKLKAALTGVQIIGGMDPDPITGPILGAATQYIGEAGKSLLDDFDIQQANKRGMTAAGTDLMIRLALSGFPPVLAKLGPTGAKLFSKVGRTPIAKEMANEIADKAVGSSGLAGLAKDGIQEQAQPSGLLGKAGEFLVRNKLKDGQVKYSDEVIQKVIDNPDLIKTKGTFERPLPLGKKLKDGQLDDSIYDISAKARRAIIQLEEDLGNEVGRTRKMLGVQKIPVNPSKVIQRLDDSKQEFVRTHVEKNALTKQGLKQPVVDEHGAMALDEIGKALDIDSPKQAMVVNKYPKGSLVIDKGKTQVPLKNDLTNAEDLQVALKSIDSSSPFKTIYTKMNNGEQLSYAESRALEIRNMIRDEVDNGVMQALDGTGFKEARQNFATVKQAIKSPEIRRAYYTDQNMERALVSSMKKGNVGAFKEFQILDDYLPPERKFLDKAISRQIGDELFRIFPENSSEKAGWARSMAGRVGQELIQPDVMGSGGILAAGLASGRTLLGKVAAEKVEPKKDAAFKFTVPR